MKSRTIAILLAAAGVFSAVGAAQAQSAADRVYAIDSRNEVVKSGAGLCWRTGYWTPAAAANDPAGCSCDKDLMPKTQCDPVAVGFKQIVIKPVPVGDLTWVKARYDSLYGRIVSNWRILGDRLTMEVTIPANTTATIHVPTLDPTAVTESGQPVAKADGIKFVRMDGGVAVFAVGSGAYLFAAPFNSTKK